MQVLDYLFEHVMCNVHHISWKLDVKFSLTLSVFSLRAKEMGMQLTRFYFLPITFSLN